MSRPSKQNQVAVSPFSLRESGPMLTTEAYAKCGYRWFRAAGGKEIDPKATIDPTPCPHCVGPVEWAVTVKYGALKPDGKPSQDRYVYARCQINPASHRWGFKNTDPNAAKPTPPKPPTPAEPESKPMGTIKYTCKHCTMAFQESVDFKVHMMQKHGIDWFPSGPTASNIFKQLYNNLPQHTPTNPPTTTPAPGPDMTTNLTPAASNPFAAFEAWIDSKVGARLAEAETAIKALKTTGGATEEDLKAIEAKLTEAINATRRVEITIPSMPTAHFEGKAHKLLERILRLIAAGERFFMLVGPAATGKSTLARQVATTLKRSFTAVSINETMAREDILGCRAHDLMKGTVKYSGSTVVETWEAHGVILLDECDRGNPNTLTAINAIEQNCLYVPRNAEEGGTEAKSDKAIIIATANTYGTGANRAYVGANQLDGAFLNRFRTLPVGYDSEIERTVCGGDALAAEAVTYLEGARKRMEAAQVRRMLTTRDARRAVVDQRLSGGTLTTGAALKALASEAGWTTTELNSVFN